jgi:hypothetical protein
MLGYNKPNSCAYKKNRMGFPQPDPHYFGSTGTVQGKPPRYVGARKWSTATFISSTCRVFKGAA